MFSPASGLGALPAFFCSASKAFCFFSSLYFAWPVSTRFLAVSGCTEYSLSGVSFCFLSVACVIPITVSFSRVFSVLPFSVTLILFNLSG
jgi:hypothetical protein